MAGRWPFSRGLAALFCEPAGAFENNNAISNSRIGPFIVVTTLCDLFSHTTRPFCVFDDPLNEFEHDFIEGIGRRFHSIPMGWEDAFYTRKSSEATQPTE